MSVGLGKNGELAIKGSILAYAQKLFKQKDYFGAFASLHSLIESWMQELYERDYANKHTILETDERSKKGYRYNQLRRDLLGLHLISDKEATDIADFDTLRDRVVHRAVKDQFRASEQYRVKEAEVIEGFNKGIKVAKLLRARCGGRFTTRVLLDKSGKATITVPMQARTLVGIGLRTDKPPTPGSITLAFTENRDKTKQA